MKYVTIKDIAAELHLSVSTVSRALSGDTIIRKETRELVEQTAARMGYRRNVAAARLRSGRTNIIGVVVNEMLTPFASKVLEGIQEVLQPKGISVMVMNSHDDVCRERESLAHMESMRVDGMIVTPCNSGLNCDVFRRLLEHRYPMVFFGRMLRDVNVSGVTTNDYDKAFYLTEHLIRIGKRRILHMRGPAEVSTYENIFRGYKDCLRKFGIEFDPRLVRMSDPHRFEGVRHMDSLEEEGVDFDAVLTCTDINAIEIMNHLRRKGINVPADVAVAGFLGSPLSRMIYPSLTTVEGNLHEMGRRAATLLLRLIDDPAIEPVQEVVGSEICLRESTQMTIPVG